MVKRFIETFVGIRGMAVLAFCLCGAMIVRTAYLQIAMGWMSTAASCQVAVFMLAVLCVGLITAVRWAG